MSLVRHNELSDVEKFLLEALGQLDMWYISIDYNNIANGTQRPERSFVAELYHQLKKKQEQERTFIGFRFQVEPLKKFNPTTFWTFENYEIDSVVPDLVLHKNQLSRRGEDQLLACEVKASTGDFEKDLLKLCIYASEFNFQNACFIFTDNKAAIERFLRNLQSIELKEWVIECGITFIAREQKGWIAHKLHHQKTK